MGQWVIFIFSKFCIMSMYSFNSQKAIKIGFTNPGLYKYPQNCGQYFRGTPNSAECYGSHLLCSKYFTSNNAYWYYIGVF